MRKRERGREEDTEMGRRIFYLLVHSPNVYNNYGWSRPKPSSQNTELHAGVPCGRERPKPCVSFHCLPSINMEWDQKQNSWDLDYISNMRCQYLRWLLHPVCYNTGSKVSWFLACQSPTFRVFGTHKMYLSKRGRWMGTGGEKITKRKQQYLKQSGLCSSPKFIIYLVFVLSK